MKAVHFGAGNIGRGFIGLLYFESNYATTFIDVSADVIDALNSDKSYQVTYASDEGEVFQIENVAGINSITDPDAVVQAITQADIITTAVGPTILPIISELLAKGLAARVASGRPLNIIACENMISGSDFLKKHVYKHVAAGEREDFEQLYRFPNAAVDRIVPNQVHENILEVSVEPYFEWVVEDNFVGVKPDIKGITIVGTLESFIERKLFTVNTGHATTAYIGHYLGHETITDALGDERVLELLRGVLEETSEVLVELYDFNEAAHKEYVETTISRFLNKHISDEVTRVARGPIRKLGKNDRLIRPAMNYVSLKDAVPNHLAKVVALVMLYENEADEEAVALQKMIGEKGLAGALAEVSELDQHSDFIKHVLEKVAALGK